MSRRPYDIAIVGGGVAGCAAALSLADSGYAAVVVGPLASDAERQGELLAPQAHVHLRPLGLEEAFLAGPHRPARTTVAAWESAVLVERKTEPHADGPGHLIDRQAFATMLRDAVLESGATLQVGALAGARFDGRMWSLALASGQTLAVRFVIDCSGRAAVIGRRHAALQQRDRMTVAHVVLDRRESGREPVQTTLIEAVPEGWWQATLLPSGQMQLALFAEADGLPADLEGNEAAWRERIAATLHTRRWLDAAGYAIGGAPKLVPLGTSWLEPAAGQGWAAAGDAAAGFDPLAAQGLTTALWSGRRAALAAAAHLSGDARALDGYVAALREAVQAAMTQRRTVYGQQPRWGTQPFWERRR